MDFKALKKTLAALHPVVESTLRANQERCLQAVQRGELSNASDVYYVLVARKHFHSGEKLCLRWRGPRGVGKAVIDYANQVIDLRNGEFSDIHVTRLKFYSDASFDSTAILSHSLSYETGMQIQCLLRLVENEDRLCVAIR